MRELPEGTVTFLFTDIEGSTQLIHQLGASYTEVLAEHRRVLRHAIAAHGGVEVDTQGDAFFVAFAEAGRAVGGGRGAARPPPRGPGGGPAGCPPPPATRPAGGVGGLRAGPRAAL